MNIDFFDESDSEKEDDAGQNVETDETEQRERFDESDNEEPDGKIAEHEAEHEEESREDKETYGETEKDKEPPIDEKDFIKVALDWVELEAALENNSPELHSFLNKVTGDVIRVFEGTENAAVRLKQAESSPDHLYVDPISSREQYRWMEEFIETVEEPTLRDKLNIAIDGKGAFRRFKDVLVSYPDERESWFDKRSTKLRAFMKDWLTNKGVSPTNSPPWEGGEEERRPQSDFESRSRHIDVGDLRAVAHEALDLVPSREIPTALAFLEFLRGRRGPRRSRYS